MATKPTTTVAIDAKTLTPPRPPAPPATVVLPSWLPNGCPAWCDAFPHKDVDRYDDRTHSGLTAHVTLTAEEPPSCSDGKRNEYFNDPTHAAVFLVQHYREAEARVWVGRDETNAGFYLTVDEAEELSHALLDRVTAARDAVEAAERAAIERVEAGQ